MIVTLDSAIERYQHPCNRIGLLLRQVETKEEAFAEMRRFLEVNNIPSDYTSIWTHKYTEVTMGYDGYIDPSDETIKVIGVTFGLRDDKDRPRHETLGTPEDWGLEEERDWRTGEIRLVEKRSYSMLTDTAEWYNCAKRYFDDLRVRKGGDE